jgi:hypothetical protein
MQVGIGNFSSVKLEMNKCPQKEALVVEKNQLMIFYLSANMIFLLI